MQRRSSPSRRPSDNGASRWQQRSSIATTEPLLVRYNTSGSFMIVRAISPSPATSCDHAATYQALRTHIVLFRCHRASFVLDQTVHRAAHVQASRVGDDVHQRGFAEFGQACLLRFHYRLVLEKRGGDLTEELLGRGGIVLPEAVGGRPE